MGVSGMATTVTLEKCGHNVGYKGLDNCRFCPGSQCCVEGGPECIDSIIDMDTVCKRVSALGLDVTVTISKDAGRYGMAGMDGGEEIRIAVLVPSVLSHEARTLLTGLAALSVLLQSHIYDGKRRDFYVLLSRLRLKQLQTRYTWLASRFLLQDVAAMLNEKNTGCPVLQFACCICC